MFETGYAGVPGRERQCGADSDSHRGSRSRGRSLRGEGPLAQGRTGKTETEVG